MDKYPVNYCCVFYMKVESIACYEAMTHAICLRDFIYCFKVFDSKTSKGIHKVNPFNILDYLF